MNIKDIIKKEYNKISFFRIFISIIIWFHILAFGYTMRDYITQTNNGSKEGTCKIINNNVRRIYHSDSWASTTIYHKDWSYSNHYVALTNTGKILDYSYWIIGTIDSKEFPGIQEEDSKIVVNLYYLNWIPHFNILTPITIWEMYLFIIYNYNWDIDDSFSTYLKPEKEWWLFQWTEKYKSTIWKT